MGKQIMLVNVHEDETRIALVENQILVGLHVQQTDRERKVGNIYRGRIVKINPAFQAAFVDYGEPRNGFLSISDVNFHLHRPKDGEKGRPKIQNVLREGQPVMVQIIKEGMSNKGSALTTFISLAGRYMVMSPNSERSGVSRKIEDPDTRRRLKDIMEALAGGEDLGVIIRTAGIDQPVSELKKDLEALRKEWKNIQARFDKERKAGLLYQEPSPIVRVLRDYFSDAVQEVWVDDAEGFQEALRYFKSTLPKYQKRLKLYVGDKSLFSAYRIEEQIESLDTAKVPLKSGGSVVIESTEALVSVDVNSGRSNQAQDIEETALRTNMEAADEIARQLRLRNLGGLIVIDFIDMMQAKNRRQVEKRIAEVLKDDKARTTIGEISQFGLLELSRQRIDMELSRGLRVQCPNCGGTGHIPTVNSSANNVLRKIRELAATGEYVEIHGTLPLDSANYLLNEKREAVRDLELEFELAVRLEGDPDLPAGHPTTLHGVKATGEEAEADRGEARPARGERVEGRAEREEPRAEGRGNGTAAPMEDDSGRRRRRRRRRRGRGEESVHGPYRETESLRDAPEDEAPADLAAADRFDEVLEVEPLSESEPALHEPEPHEPERHEPHAARAESEPHADRPPRRGGRHGSERRPPRAEPMPEAASDNGQLKGLMFKSEHIVTNPEAMDKMPPRMVRSNPFREMADSLPENSVVFDSAGIHKPGEEIEPPAAPSNGDGAEEEAPAGPRRRRPRRGRRAGAHEEQPAVETREAAEPAAPAAPEDTGYAAEDPSAPEPGNELERWVEPEPDEDLNIGNVVEPEGPAPGNELHPRRRSRRGRGRPRAAGEASGGGRPPAPERPAGNRADAAPGDGARPGARRGRPRRGRGRGPRPPGQPGVPSAN